MIEIVNIKDPDELIFGLNSFSNNYIYRGHASSEWALSSTLERLLKPNRYCEQCSRFEKHALSTFKSKYSIYGGIEARPHSRLGWLSLMQHYGVPTKLIDFSESPYVALYFALEAHDGDEGGAFAVYAIDYSAIMDVSITCISDHDSSFTRSRFDVAESKDQIFEEIFNRFTYEVLWVTEPLEMNVRIDRQTGTFLLSGSPKKTVEELLGSDTYSKCHSVKFIIPRKLHKNIFALLRKMNINAKTIYGDLSGLAKSIKMELQVYAI